MENENLELLPEDMPSDDLDYKALYEKEKERADKWQSRYKSQKAQEKERAQYEIDDSYIDKRVKEEMFFQNNSTASEFREEVKAIQSKYSWMDAKTAYNLYLAENKPEMLSKAKSSTGVEWITPDFKPEKDPKDMDDKEFNERWVSRKGK